LRPEAKPKEPDEDRRQKYHDDAKKRHEGDGKLGRGKPKAAKVAKPAELGGRGREDPKERAALHRWQQHAVVGAVVAGRKRRAVGHRHGEERREGSGDEQQREVARELAEPVRRHVAARDGEHVAQLGDALGDHAFGEQRHHGQVAGRHHERRQERRREVAHLESGRARTRAGGRSGRIRVQIIITFLNESYKTKEAARVRVDLKGREYERAHLRSIVV
jgi:hypothetical protein